MTVEIELSILDNGRQSIRPVLDQFEAETGIHVRVREMDWESGWNELVRAALYKDGPDISEIGTTWTGDLCGMNALRPFEAAEVKRIGGAADFNAGAWRSASLGSETLWAVPWLCGARTIFYRWALLEQAGLDPSTAFTTPAALETTLQKLQDHGCYLPWLVPLAGTHETTHNVATWLWAAGGDFLHPDNKSLALLESPALDGMIAYFSLSRFFPDEVRQLTSIAPQVLFEDDPRAAVTISGPWMVGELRERLGKRLEQEISLTPPPGPSFVGGSNLVVWKYSRQSEAAIRLALYLASTQAQVAYSPRAGLLPARIDALQAPPFATDPFQQAAVQSLLTGRSLPSISLWGLVEERLSIGFNNVWKALLSAPGQNVRTVLLRELEPLRKRLDLLLSGR